MHIWVVLLSASIYGASVGNEYWLLMGVVDDSFFGVRGSASYMVG